MLIKYFGSSYAFKGIPSCGGGGEANGRMGMSLEIGLNIGSLWASFRAYTLPAEASVSWVPLAKLSEARPCVLI